MKREAAANLRNILAGIRQQRESHNKRRKHGPKRIPGKNTTVTAGGRNLKGEGETKFIGGNYALSGQMVGRKKRGGGGLKLVRKRGRR